MVPSACAAAHAATVCRQGQDAGAPPGYVGMQPRKHKLFTVNPRNLQLYDPFTPETGAVLPAPPGGPRTMAEMGLGTRGPVVGGVEARRVEKGAAASAVSRSRLHSAPSAAHCGAQHAQHHGV